MPSGNETSRAMNFHDLTSRETPSESQRSNYMSESITKALATITDPSADDSPYGGFTAVLSTASLDRDGDELARSEWIEPLPDQITLDIDHQMSVAGTIGSATPYFDDDGRLMMDARFASTPLAQEARSLVTEGHVRSVSVAFLSDKSQKDAAPRRELLNAGLVSVPSNRDAIILSSKAFEAIAEYRKAAKDDPAEDDKNVGAPVTVKAASDEASAPKMVQAIHDASNILGAACVTEAEPDADDGAADGANKSVSKKHGFQAFVVGKALTGSVEDLGCRIQCALDDVSGAGDYGGMYAYVMATFLNPDGKGGSVVYRLGGETLCRAFSDDGSCVALDSTIQVVTLVTSVAAVPDTVDDDATPLPPAVEESGKSLAPDVPTKSTVEVVVGAGGGGGGGGASDAGAVSIEEKPTVDMASFKSQLDALTGETSAVAQTSGAEPGSPDSPVDSPTDPPVSPDSKAAPTRPADDDESADTAGDVADSEDEDEPDRDKEEEEKRLQLLRTRILATNARSMALVP
jgi:hypothetical protein